MVNRRETSEKINTTKIEEENVETSSTTYTNSQQTISSLQSVSLTSLASIASTLILVGPIICYKLNGNG